jgi:hypothetical protein
LLSIHVKYLIVLKFQTKPSHLALTWCNTGTNSTHVYEFLCSLWPDRFHLLCFLFFSFLFGQQADRPSICIVAWQSTDMLLRKLHSNT